MSEIKVQADTDRDGVVIILPTLGTYHLLHADREEIGMEWRHLRGLRDAIIEFLGADQ